jgi:rhodanese-related sulfurtransferase
VARQLQKAGFEASALVGGYNAWRASHPVEPKSGEAKRAS